MKSSEKLNILIYLMNQGKLTFEGTIEDYIRAEYKYKASNVARVCRQLREDGLIRKVPQPHPETGREVNAYLITDEGLAYITDRQTPTVKEFLQQFPSKKPQELVGTLF